MAKPIHERDIYAALAPPPDLHVDTIRWPAETLRALRLQSDQGYREQLHTELSSTQSGLHYFPSPTFINFEQRTNADPLHAEFFVNRYALGMFHLILLPLHDDCYTQIHLDLVTFCHTSHLLS